jgi:hypothetical protein
MDFQLKGLSSRSEDARGFLQFHQVQKGIVDGLARVSEWQRSGGNLSST